MRTTTSLVNVTNFVKKKGNGLDSRNGSMKRTRLILYTWIRTDETAPLSTVLVDISQTLNNGGVLVETDRRRLAEGEFD